MTLYDREALIAQLETVRSLDADGRRLVGEVLVEYGQEMIGSADRLERLQELMGGRRTHEQDAIQRIVEAWDTWIKWAERHEIPVPAGIAPFRNAMQNLVALEGSGPTKGNTHE